MEFIGGPHKKVGFGSLRYTLSSASERAVVPRLSGRGAGQPADFCTGALAVQGLLLKRFRGCLGLRVEGSGSRGVSKASRVLGAFFSSNPKP